MLSFFVDCIILSVLTQKSISINDSTKRNFLIKGIGSLVRDEKWKVIGPWSKALEYLSKSVLCNIFLIFLQHFTLLHYTITAIISPLIYGNSITRNRFVKCVWKLCDGFFEIVKAFQLFSLLGNKLDRRISKRSKSDGVAYLRCQTLRRLNMALQLCDKFNQNVRQMSSSWLEVLRPFCAIQNPCIILLQDLWINCYDFPENFIFQSNFNSVTVTRRV